MKREDADEQRREFIKLAGLGSLALMAGPRIGSDQARSLIGGTDALTGFHFVAMADAGEDTQGINRMFATGSGWFNHEVGIGGGFYNHFAWAFPAPMAFRALGTGTWKAGQVIDFTKTEQEPGPPEVVNPWGFNLSGVLEMKVSLYPSDGPSTGVPAVMKIICNIPPSNAFTGLPEGYFLDVEDFGLSFEPATFPPGPPFGITSFSVPV